MKYPKVCFSWERAANSQMLLTCVYISLFHLHSPSSPGPAEVQERQECQYGENCTFAYCQEEIDVWTQERKGALSRELLFDPLGSTERRALSVTRLLQLHMGMFMFLCEVRTYPERISNLFFLLCFDLYLWHIGSNLFPYLHLSSLSTGMF